MKKELLYFVAFFLATLSHAQFTCPNLIGPFDGDGGVPVSSTISWTAVPDVPSYLISLGTTLGGTDIVDNESAGSPQYTPPLNLPENSTIYVTITLFFFDREGIVCPLGMFQTEDVTTAPLCITEIFPNNGDIDIDVQPVISWSNTNTATGYTLFLGTSSGNYNILNGLIIEDALSYELQTELTFETTFFIQIIPFNENGTPQNCQEISFTTQAEVFLPACAQLISPADGEVNVPLTPRLTWDEIPNADGYRVSIGYSPTTNDIVDNSPYGENSIEVIDFLPNRTFYVTIRPFNEAGVAFGCIQTSFTTLLGCGPIEDEISGEILYFGPQIDFPSEITLCLNEIPTIVTTEISADGHRWYRINDDQTETLLSETEDLPLFELGIYRYEAYNLVNQLGDAFECSDSKIFFVSSSEKATITSIETNENDGLLRIEVKVSGIGNYEYAINSRQGPYQRSNFFDNITTGAHTIYVRDKNGCGITEQKIFEGLTSEWFPKFFTPNGDGVNDFWQFIPLDDNVGIEIGTISIFNKYGRLVKQIEPNSTGWDGNFNGTPLPASDYWFMTKSQSNKNIQGHFTLKR